jgi:hypothetical protein
MRALVPKPAAPAQTRIEVELPCAPALVAVGCDLAYAGTRILADVMEPSIKERLWHKMRADLAKFLPELIRPLGNNSGPPTKPFSRTDEAGLGSGSV